MWFGVMMFPQNLQSHSWVCFLVNEDEGVRFYGYCQVIGTVFFVSINVRRGSMCTQFRAV